MGRVPPPPPPTRVVVGGGGWPPLPKPLPPPPPPFTEASWNRGRHPLLHTPTPGQVIEAGLGTGAPYAREQHEGGSVRVIDRRRFIQPLEPSPSAARAERPVEELWAEYQATTPPELREQEEP